MPKGKAAVLWHKPCQKENQHETNTFCSSIYHCLGADHCARTATSFCRTSGRSIDTQSTTSTPIQSSMQKRGRRHDLHRAIQRPTVRGRQWRDLWHGRVNAYEAFQFQNRSVVGHRYYDQNGNLTRRHFHEVDTGTLTNPTNHVSVFFTGRGTTLHDLSVPGDITSGTQILTGNFRVYCHTDEP